MRFLITSALDPLPLPEGEDGIEVKEGYDTVVQTIGLCSTPEPERLLKNVAHVLKPDGKILLLEHGRSHYGWINDMMDDNARAHADKFGCWWNRDIGAIVKNSGLDVVKMYRPWFWAQMGTLWWVEMRRPQDWEKLTTGQEMVDASRAQESARIKTGSVEDHAGRYRPWWKFWG